MGKNTRSFCRWSSWNRLQPPRELFAWMEHLQPITWKKARCVGHVGRSWTLNKAKLHEIARLNLNWGFMILMVDECSWNWWYAPNGCWRGIGMAYGIGVSLWCDSRPGKQTICSVKVLGLRRGWSWQVVAMASISGRSDHVPPIADLLNINHPKRIAELPRSSLGPFGPVVDENSKPSTRYIHHEGGGWCESLDDCLGRSKTASWSQRDPKKMLRRNKRGIIMNHPKFGNLV